MKSIQIMINGAVEHLPLGERKEVFVSDLIRAKSLENKRIAIEVNKRIVSRSRFDNTQLREGDQVEVVAAIGGG